MPINSETHTQTYILRDSFHRIDQIKARFRIRRYEQVPTNYEIIDEALRIYDLYITKKLAEKDKEYVEGQGNDD
jgi:hypothetical protein